MKYVSLFFMTFVLIAVMATSFSKSSYAACTQGLGGATATSSSSPSNTGTETRDQRSIQFAQNCEGGEQLTVFLTELYDDYILPSFQAMAAQLGVSIKEQTSAFGKMIDSQTQTKTQAMIQQLERTGRLQLRPSENVCMAKTQNSAMVRTEHVASAISSGYQTETVSREMNSLGSSTENGFGQDLRIRWEDYTTIFCSANSNGGGGAAGCAADGTMPNSDVNIEQFLLSDTIDQGPPEAQIAAQTILRNLVEPRVLEPIAESALNSPTGRESFMTRRHLMAVRQIPVSVVGNIIARRTGVPGNPAALQTQAIRTTAGVPAADISANPSYNETMLAMTKERFLHPEYFKEVSGSIEKAQQEQASVEEYISIQLLDIYDLQEQINALIATRASLKFNKNSLGSSKSGQTIK